MNNEVIGFGICVSYVIELKIMLQTCVESSIRNEKVCTLELKIGHVWIIDGQEIM